MTRKRKPPTMGEEIIAGLREAIAFQRGQLHGARVTHVPLIASAVRVKPAPRYTGARVARLRARLALSQTVFAVLFTFCAARRVSRRWR